MGINQFCHQQLFQTIVISLLRMRMSFATEGVLRDFCEKDVFSASCPTGKVIYIEEARYGRMELGTCLKLDVGYLDCSSDIITILDKMCSGRTSCEFAVNTLMLETEPCPMELRSYLQASYICLPVWSPGEFCCQSHGDVVNMVSSIGYIASSVTEMTGCGTSDCPWKLTAPQGQQLNISLYDFAVTSASASIPNNGSSTRRTFTSCVIYAVIKEEYDDAYVSVCAGNERISHVYTSTSDTIEIHIISKKQTNTDLPKFVIKYEAFGCLNPEPPSFGYVERMGGRALVGCDNSRGGSWEIICNGSEWTGNFGNCTMEKTNVVKVGELRPHVTSVEIMSPEIIIVFIVAIALVITAAIITLGIVFLKRAPRNQEQMYHTYLGPIPDTHASKRDSFVSQTQRNPKYYSSYQRSKIPWQSTRPLPDPETNCAVQYINDQGTIRSSIGRRYSDRTDGRAKYDVLDPAFMAPEHEIFEGD